MEPEDLKTLFEYLKEIKQLLEAILYELRELNREKDDYDRE